MLSSALQTRDGAETLEQLRLIMGFRSVADLLEFIDGMAVDTASNEFIDNYLVENQAYHNNPSLNVVSNSIGANRALGGQNDRYARVNRDMTAWRVEHHFARFMVRAYDLAQASDSSWSGIDEPDTSIVLWQLYELLCYLIRR